MSEEQKLRAKPTKPTSKKRSRSAASSMVQVIVGLSFTDFCKKLDHHEGYTHDEKDELKERYRGKKRLMRQELLHGLLIDEKRRMPCIEEA